MSQKRTEYLGHTLDAESLYSALKQVEMIGAPKPSNIKKIQSSRVTEQLSEVRTKPVSSGASTSQAVEKRRVL